MHIARTTGTRSTHALRTLCTAPARVRVCARTRTCASVCAHSHTNSLDISKLASCAALPHGPDLLIQSLLISIMLYSCNFFIQELYPLRVLANVVVRVFAIIIIGISTIALIIAIAVVENPNNDYSKYPQYDI